MKPGISERTEPSDELLYPLIIIEASTLTNFPTDIIPLFVAKHCGYFWPLSAEIVKVFRNQNTINAGVSFGMILALLAIFIGVKRVQLQPLGVVGRSVVNVIAAALFPATISLRSLSREARIAPVRSEITGFRDHHGMDEP